MRSSQMIRILSISYDETLLRTRQMLLHHVGYHVTSAFGYSAAIRESAQGDFDLVIMGHSIPHEDKEAIAKQVRIASNAPILSLLRHTEPILTVAEYNVSPDDPAALLQYIQEITHRAEGKAT